MRRVVRQLNDRGNVCVKNDTYSNTITTISLAFLTSWMIMISIAHTCLQIPLSLFLDRTLFALQTWNIFFISHILNFVLLFIHEQQWCSIIFVWNELKYPMSFIVNYLIENSRMIFKLKMNIMIVRRTSSNELSYHCIFARFVCFPRKKQNTVSLRTDGRSVWSCAPLSAIFTVLQMYL
jgi:hypothetical protein